MLDVGRGRWPYATRWNWGGGAGRQPHGGVVGLQFGGKWTEGTGFTENGVIVDGRVTKIGGELAWDYDWDQPLRPWRVHDPAAASISRSRPATTATAVNAVVLATEVHQVFGTWTGYVTDDAGTIHVEAIQGFAEESRFALVGPATRDDRRVSDDVLSASGLRKSYGSVPRRRRRVVPGRRRGDLRPARAERGRQNDDDLDGVRPSPPDGGEVGSGRAWGGSTDAEAAIGLVPQELALYDELTAARTCGSSGAEGDRRRARRRGRVVLEFVGLADRAATGSKATRGG